MSRFPQQAVEAMKKYVAPRQGVTAVPGDVMAAIIAGLEADGYKIERPAPYQATWENPPNAEYTTLLTGVGPPYSGRSGNGRPALGCAMQVARSHRGVDFDALRTAEAPFAHPPLSFKGLPSSASGSACRCAIAENGCIDNSLCPGGHPLSGVPALSRWYQDSEALIHGACYLPAWTGWAGPAVMGLLGRRPVASDILALWDRSAPNTRHNWFFHVRKVYTGECGTPLYHLYPAMKIAPDMSPPPGAMRFRAALLSLPPGARVGQEPSFELSDGATSASSSAPVPVWINNPTPIAALGGVRQVPTSIVATQVAPAANNRWNAITLPEKVCPELVTWAHNRASPLISVSRDSFFTYHFPANMNRAREPERFRESLRSTWMRVTDIEEEATVWPAQYTRSFPKESTERTMRSTFESIGRVLDNDLSLDTLKEADALEGYSRAMGSRGQRYAPNWEAHIMARWQANRDVATRSRAVRRYFEFCYRVVTRHMAALITTNLIETVPGYQRHVPDTGTNVQIIHINAETIPGVPAQPGPPPVPAVPPMWGEAAMWDPDVIDGFLQGRRQFIDAEGWSREDIAAVIGCLAPQGADNIPRLNVVDPAAGGERPSPDGEVLINVVKHFFPNGVTHIYVHHGANPIPTAADQAWIQAHAFDFPSASVLSRIMRSYSMRHGLGSTFLDALDAAIYRCVGYDFEQCSGTAPAKASDIVIDSNGSQQLFMPRNKTLFSYFDVFFLPAETPAELEAYLALEPYQLAAAGSVMCHYRSVSLSWAAKAAAETGSVWEPITPATPSILRNHHIKFIDQPYDQLNNWSTIFANAMGMQYGLAPSYLTQRTEANQLVDWWRRFVIPTLSNHYLELWGMKTIPTFQVLPYYDPDGLTSQVRWAPGTPAQTAGLPQFQQQPRVKLAREFEPFPNLSWLGDGGPEYNVQFYAAQGVTPPAGIRDQFAYERAGAQMKIQLQRWAGFTAHSFPAGPQGAILLQMAPSGSHFSDFVMPGSLLSYRLLQRSIQNWGVQQNPADVLSDREIERWWRASRGEVHQSLMVNYQSPFDAHEQVDELIDYSVVIWDRNNSFAGMTFTNLSTQLNTGTFDPVNTVVRQQPFTLSFDSRPAAYMQNQSVRIAGRRPPDEPAELAARIAATLPSGTASYQPKYPLYAQDLPEMQQVSVHADAEGIRYEPDPEAAYDPDEALQRALARLDRPEPSTQAKLERLRHLEEQMANDFAATMAAEQQQRANRALLEAQQHLSNAQAPEPHRVRATRPRLRPRTFDSNRGLFAPRTKSASMPASYGISFSAADVRELSSQIVNSMPRSSITGQVITESTHRNHRKEENRNTPPPPPLPTSSVQPNDYNAARVAQFAVTDAELLAQLQRLSKPSSPSRPYRMPDPRPNRSDFARALQQRKVELESAGKRDPKAQAPPVEPQTREEAYDVTEGATKPRVHLPPVVEEVPDEGEPDHQETPEYAEELRIARSKKGKDPIANRALAAKLPAGAVPLDFISSAPNEDAARNAFASFLAHTGKEILPGTTTPKN